MPSRAGKTARINLIMYSVGYCGPVGPSIGECLPNPDPTDAAHSPEIITTGYHYFQSYNVTPLQIDYSRTSYHSTASPQRYSFP